MKVRAVVCDRAGCGHIAMTEPGGRIPESWIRVDLYEQGFERPAPGVFCSWSCVRTWAADLPGVLDAGR